MNAKQRVQAVLEGVKPDYIPIVPKIAFANVIACEGVSVRDYMTDPECMADVCIRAAREFGWDAISVHTDISSEGMALGSVYERPAEAPAILKKYLLDDVNELDKFHIPDPYTTESMKTVIKAVQIVKEKTGDEFYLISWTNGPLNVASQIITLNELLVALIDSPEETHRLLEKCTQTACVYAKALIKAGADAIAFGHATASSNVISREYYEIFALPYEQKLISEIHQGGAKAITHICGNIHPIIDLIAENNSDIIDFDAVCDIDYLRRMAPDKVFRGNINPALFTAETPQPLVEKVRQLLEKESTKENFWLGSGCEINLNTPPENLDAFVKAGREYGQL